MAARRVFRLRAAVTACFLEVIEEVADEGCVQILEGQLRRGLPQPLFGESQEQAEGVPVSRDGVRAGSALPQETVGEEGLHQTGEVGVGTHGWTSFGLSSRRAASASNSGTASRYQ